MMSVFRCVAIVGMAVIVGSCSERPEAFYADAAAARAARAMDRGWIPDWVPTTARAIHEVHDIDTNQSLLAFSFDPADIPNVAQSCAQVSRQELKPAPFDRSWWPSDVPPSAVVTHRHVYYRCADGAYAAISAKDGQFYYWRP
jgi:hypothetical protein